MKKVNRSIRFDSESLELAAALDIDINDVARKAVQKEINYRSSKEFQMKKQADDIKKRSILKERI